MYCIDGWSPPAKFFRSITIPVILRSSFARRMVLTISNSEFSCRRSELAPSGWRQFTKPLRTVGFIDDHTRNVQQQRATTGRFFRITTTDLHPDPHTNQYEKIKNRLSTISRTKFSRRHVHLKNPAINRQRVRMYSPNLRSHLSQAQ